MAGSNSNRIKDLSGRRFGRLVAVNLGERNKHSLTWDCVCDCGTLKNVAAGHLRSGRIRSCGCLRSEKSSERLKMHGLSKTKGHQVWWNMLQRCDNPKVFHFDSYGGRGIKVCDRWYDVEKFIEDMGQPPEGYEIDRIDTNGDYTKSNCRWATRKENLTNKRNTVFVEYNGERKALSLWAEQLGIHRGTLQHRLFVKGWSPEKAFETPVRGKRLVPDDD